MGGERNVRFSKGLIGSVVDDRDELLGVLTKMDLVDVLTMRGGRAR